MKNERSFLTSQWPTWWRNSPTSQSLRAEFPRSVAWEDLHRTQTHFTLPHIDANLGTLLRGLLPILTKRSGERLYITLDADVPFIVVTQNWSKAVDKQFIAHAQIGFDRTQFNNGWLTYLKYLYLKKRTDWWRHVKPIIKGSADTLYSSACNRFKKVCALNRDFKSSDLL